MKALKRNQKLFYYSLYIDDMPILDDDGYDTGETATGYSLPQPMKANISTATGTTSIEQFGNDVKYDKVIVTTDMTCPIDENSVLYIDNADTEEVGKKYDYRVERIAKSLNSISIAVSKVDVS